MLDLSPREKVILYPLVVLVIFFGVYPGAGLRRDGRIGRSRCVSNVTASLGAAQTAAAN